MISKLIILSKQSMWLYKESKLHSLQMKIEKKALASEMNHSPD